MLIARTGKKVGSPNSFRRYDKCNMPPQKYLSSYYIQKKHGILTNQKLSTCTVVVQRCLFPSSQTCYFGRYFFSYFLICKTHKRTKIKSRVTDLLKEILWLNMQHDVV